MFLRDNFRRSTKGEIDRRRSQAMLAARATRGCDVPAVSAKDIGNAGHLRCVQTKPTFGGKHHD
jgi:hypothetical protein